MDAIIRMTSRVLFPMIMVFGVYVAVHGHLSPGGAFPAGVILASGFAILLLTHEKRDPKYEILKNNKLGWKNATELLGLMAVVLFGYIWLRAYLLGTQRFLELWSGGYTIILNTISVFFIFTAFSSVIYAMVKE